MNIADVVARTAALHPDRCAVVAPDGTVSYRQLDAASATVAGLLAEIGVAKGDRVGVWLQKGWRAIAAMQGILRLGAAYVPIDPMSPPARVGLIAADCGLAAVVSDKPEARMQVADRAVPALALPGDLLCATVRRDAAPVDPDDIAYILYTSGSTGAPKGVCITHRNAFAFFEWAAATVGAHREDRIANHAAFHFDLSVFDLYASFLVGAAVCIVPEGVAFVPERLVEFMRTRRISVWYSVPSALVLMMERGRLLETELPDLRAVIFAGEPFPINHLRRLRRHFEKIRLFNFYGPTETNVCTYHEVGTVSDDATSVPIGRACSGDRVWAVSAEGETASVGQEGELHVAGPTVMRGYWGQPAWGDRPYPTGDIVRVLRGDAFEYVGRRDHMVKLRGHRIELAEIEVTLGADSRLREAVVVVQGSGVDARLVGFVVLAHGATLSLLEAKQICAARLPRYMIVDRIYIVDELPRTGNGKIDRRRLSALADEAPPARGS